MPPFGAPSLNNSISLEPSSQSPHQHYIAEVYENHATATMSIDRASFARDERPGSGLKTMQSSPIHNTIIVASEPLVGALPPSMGDMSSFKRTHTNSASSSPSKILRPTSASKLLASFNPRYSPSSSDVANKGFKPDVSAQNDNLSVRRKPVVSYTISDDSDTNESPSAASSVFSTPPKRRSHRKVEAEEEEEDEDNSTSPDTALPGRISSAGHSLRPQSSMSLSLRAYENGDKKPPSKKRKLTIKASSKTFGAKVRSGQQLGDADELSAVAQPVRSSRGQLRHTIATETAVRRSKFFVAKRDYFLPLLPENNHIHKLLEKDTEQKGNLNSPNMPARVPKDATQPYEALQNQPKGVKATMKPYQLSGLSFLVYLHKNGLSGILGDEMGLGKTLQTLSLFQYLKENEKASYHSYQRRPSLVVCPLSVLSSWMTEARKWTPDLKVLRFHGPVHERNRLKRVAEEKEDLYGNETAQSRKKRYERKTATGKPIVSVDSQSEDESEYAKGVDLVVTTYETFTAEQQWFKRSFVWKYVVLDEGHKIKNDLSNISTALQGMSAEYRLILTGTPLQNNLVELWALLHWLYPEVFAERSAELFRSSFDLTRGKISTSVLDDSRRLLELIMLRRMKTSPGVDLNLPPKTDVLLFVPLTPMQRFWYTRLLTRADQGLLEKLFLGAKDKEKDARAQELVEAEAWQDKDIAELEALDKEGAHGGDGWEESKKIMQQALEQEEKDASKKTAWRKLMNLLMQLRKCCNHPYLLPHAEPDPYFLGDHIIHASGKFIILDKLIQELVVKQGKKVLIFSGFTRMLDCCEDFLSIRGGDGSAFRYVRLDGQTGRARRNLGIRMFNDKNSEHKVMLISTRAGGLGINLATASDVIMLDQDWNPQIMLQAEARAHRIGQTKPVTVYKLCTQGTVEEQMMGRIQKKLYLSAKVTESMRDIHSTATPKSKKKGRPGAGADDDMPQLDTSQLMSLVRRGAQTLSHPEIDVNEMLDWDWATTLEKCKDKPADIHVAGETKSEVKVDAGQEQKWLSEMEHVETTVFNGKKYTKEKDLKNNADIQQEWARADRRKGKNTTVMVDGFAVSKESMGCADWEAVPTLAGKDPRLAEIKREKKAAINNQEHCQICWDGGDIVLCSGCPRSYHYKCLDKDFMAHARGKMQFHCSQHQCADCLQKTGDAGGMIFRCRWCERGYCEDCLDWDKTELIGDNLIEYELLDYPTVTQAYYICCPNCKDHHEEDISARDFCRDRALEFERKHKEMMDERAATAISLTATQPTEVLSRAESLTDATTIQDSGVSTPQLSGLESFGFTRKRQAAPETFKSTPTKRSVRIST
ncbi:MAG: hypothetical protein M1827_002390 [Pycnora praestabilis]|nr:MAG: hypothetical protein M1827_002390 [Pycnora praestabilis]